MGNQTIGQLLQEIYHRMMACYGPQRWWPAEGPFEVMVGAVLTQAVAWLNVEKAIASLKEAKALSPQALRCLGFPELATLIRPCIYYNVKARKLKSLAHWLGECYQDNLDRLFAGSTARLREQLLAVWGIGEETADSIILYAANEPVFVIDAYTRRIISRVGLKPDNDSYSTHQSLFMENLPSDVKIFNEYHALLVCLGKDVCRSHPLCQQCCLLGICSYGVTG
ncbi:endonuclease III domain-containing protein [Chloroflexota bacterium]